MTERLTRAHRRKLESEARIKLDLDNLANIDIQHLEEDLNSQPPNETNETVNDKDENVKEQENISQEKTSEKKPLLPNKEDEKTEEEEKKEPVNTKTVAALEKEENEGESEQEYETASEKQDGTGSEQDDENMEEAEVEQEKLEEYQLGEESELSSAAQSEVESEAEKSDSDEEEDSDSDEDESESDSESEEEEEEEEEEEDDDDDLEDLLLKAQKALTQKNDDMIGLEKSTKPTFSLPKLKSGLSVEDELYIKPTKNKAAKLVDSAVELVSSNERASKKAPLTVVANKDQEKKVSRKERQAEREKTTGKGWFDMGKTEITPEVKRDLEVLKMRHILDRKRHYKKMGKRPDPKYFQIGTIIESPTEFFSARMTKKERKQNIVDELMASDELKQYYKRKFNEVQERTNSGGKKHYKKLKAKKQWAK